MKKNLLNIFTLLCAVAIVTSCSKEDTLPQDTTTVGAISKDRELVGTNQKILLACEMAVSENATDVSIQWETANGITVEQDRFENGISYCTFVWNAPGDYTVKCKTTYFYGSEVKTSEKPLTVTVCKTDFCNSFLGDDLKTTLIDNPGLSKENGYLLQESPTLLHQFEFKRNVLERGLTIEAKTNTGTPSPKAGYSFFMSEVAKHKKDAIDTEYFLENNPDFIPTTQQEAVLKKFISGELLSDDERIILGLLIDDYSIRLTASVLTENWEGKPILISLECGADGLNTYRLSTTVSWAKLA